MVSLQQLSTSLDLTSLSGVGPKTLSLLAQLNIQNFIDLLFHLPSRYEDRTRITMMRDLRPGDRVLVEGKITQSRIIGRRGSLVLTLADKTGSINIRFFHFNRAQKERLTQLDTEIRCFGEVRMGYRGGFEMVHPEYRDLRFVNELALADHLTPVYPVTKGLNQTTLRKLLRQALSYLDRLNIPELLPNEIATKFQQLSLADALRVVHLPTPEMSVEKLLAGQHPAQQRLAFEELLAHNISLQRLRLAFKQKPAPALALENKYCSQFIENLPYQLTTAQQRVYAEIRQDMALPSPMLRLLQGDVGAGKTVIAALALLQAVEAGFQAALMAPTEILAEQHLQNLTQWFAPFKINIAWLAGRQTTAVKAEIIQRIASGECQVVIGTHAVFQANVKFNKLAVIVIDEQHRFGVHQRLALTEKGLQDNKHSHQLIMTATPIPRTLAMTAYADLDLSVIDELPPGRKPITTLLVSQKRREEIIARVGAHCAASQQAYWVCTLIDESENLRAKAAEKTYQELVQALPDLKIALVHGRLKSDKKEQIMQAFKRGEIHLLIATTVIEVGVDVPNASLMIIDNAERLGLAQLHQLRGRVGRGEKASHCVLLYQGPLSLTAQQRLQIMRKTQDGFEIAKVDMQMRGPGEVLGTKQAGLISLRIADIIRDKNLSPEVKRFGKIIAAKNPELAEQLVQRWLKGLLRYGEV
ncbi:MAG: ATP-dependent DNA helicase RecG [Gammaproteobacteria bacterium]|nr:ATP-dependent DNA helicase RecG [Gammaproteobacteria bacterium]